MLDRRAFLDAGSHRGAARYGGQQAGKVPCQPVRRSAMASTITAVARDFFAACEAGKGWEGCRQYCKPDATFSAQAEPLADVRTLQQYTDWMKGMLTPLPDGRYELKSFATDEEDRKSTRLNSSHSQISYAVF